MNSLSLYKDVHRHLLGGPSTNYKSPFEHSGCCSAFMQTSIGASVDVHLILYGRASVPV